MIKVFYDGYCALCLRSVQIINKYGLPGKFKLIAQHSSEGALFMQSAAVQESGEDSFWVESNGMTLNKSAAAFQILTYLRAPFSWLRIFSLLPIGLTDKAYDVIARHRYNIFGKLTDE